MRAYIAITPLELQTFLTDGFFEIAQGLIVEPEALDGAQMDEAEQEELEFETSWNAALISRQKQGSDKFLGLVLAVDLEKDQMGKVEGNQVELRSKLSWTQVQSLLVADSEEFELSWFAPQEIATYLPKWLA